MKYTRLYATPDGQTHLDDVERALEAASIYDWRPSAIPVEGGAFFVRRAGEHSRGWHSAPQRQFLVTLVGNVEFETSDGTLREFGPGSVVLVEDTTGVGHQTRFAGGQEHVTLFIPLAEGVLAE